MKYRKVFYSEEKNKVRSKSFDWVSNSTLNEEDDFEYVGTMTPTELDLLVESLFSKFFYLKYIIQVSVLYLRFIQKNVISF